MREILLPFLLLAALANVPTIKLDPDGRINCDFLRAHYSFLERAKDDEIRVVFLGDSITQGWSWGGHKVIWDRYFGEYDAANFGISGDRTEHVLWRIENGELDRVKPRVVVLLIGTNNIHSSAEEIRDGVIAVVRRIQEKLPKSKLVIMGVFPRAFDASDPARAKIRTVNAALAKLDDGTSTRFLDIGDRFLAADGSLPKEIMPDALHLSEKGYQIWAEALNPILTDLAAPPSAQTPPAVHPDSWPQLQPAVPRDAALEKRIDDLLKRMTLEQKVGQVIQPSITTITPEDVRSYHLGSVLNGGGGWPGDVRKARPQDWLALADRFYDASMDTTGGRLAIPVMWGSDAVHGHNNIVGATLFPHNVGLGAMRNPDLIRRIGEVTAAEMTITGIDWNFSPTVAVARDDRWGRAYESYSEEPEVVRTYAESMIRGLQGDPRSPDFLGRARVIATAKHFLGDGGTEGGRDQGNTVATEVELRDIHGAGYVGAIRGGVQAIMASYNSWHGRKMHGVGELLTDVLKKRMGFDGLIVGDWNGHGQVAGCTNASCPQSFNAGVDIFMVPEDWKKLYENTLAQVRSGEISRERLDDAVRRILRVKFRAGLFSAGRPSQRPLGGEFSRIGSAAHRAVARQAVRESLVLLKNNGNILPISPRRHVLVAGDGADNIAKQSGGWTLTWQGDGNTNADFPGATSIGAGIRAVVEAAGGRASISVDGSYEQKPDVAIVVFGENPYAEFQGDRQTIVYEGESDLALLRKLKTAGIPVVSVFLSGRPLWVNPHLNASDAFVAAWLPGTEGAGIADVLIGDRDGKPRFGFKGKLSFSWPKLPTQAVLNRGAASYDPLFEYGFGLTYGDRRDLPTQPVDLSGLDQTRSDVYFVAGRSGTWQWKNTSAQISASGEGVDLRLPASQRSEVALTGGPMLDISREANGNLALAIKTMVLSKPAGRVTLSVAGGSVDITPVIASLPMNEWQTIRVRLRCFADAGADMTRVDVPLRLSSDGELAIRVADIRLVPVADQTCP